MATTLTQPDGTSTNTGASVTQAPTSTAATALDPDDNFLLANYRYVNDESWPSNFKLDIDLDNWEEWSFKVSLLAGRQGFTKWLNGTLIQPNVVTHARAHHVWAENDCSLRAFIFSHISRNDYRSVSHLATSHAVFEELRKTHEKQGFHAQMILVKKAMEMRFRSDVPLSKTAEEIDELHYRIVKMGPLDNDLLKAVFFLNALNDNFEDLQSNLMSMADDPSFSSKTIIRNLRQEVNLMRVGAFPVRK